MKIKIVKINKNAKIPNYAHDGDAGMDLFSCVDEKILPKERKAIATGISLEIPKGYVGLIWDKSGLAVKSGIKTMAGVIDSGYRGEIQIVIYNTSQEQFIFEKGDKVAQMLIQKVENPELVEVKNISQTNRGADGFGSTGKN
ncbi:MAG: deoxyuridine 5''-triphosphate nucleotidohydrolase [Berkelbacteria bacterium GW2011_GWA2_35_9]|uniref:dUTP diphosphatase n=1 Tax=Berkelbacteria bacterium GW2011_GWA2_35_9 TaxID=1618333 RepID=A0A0G0FLD8_9BACT|nr:MAG: deoxyuridine 5''-triphosphate nucleotidohydrolase [Berkelbacteria bacterium GW2011_GWA2_35_9]